MKISAKLSILSGISILCCSVAVCVLSIVIFNRGFMATINETLDTTRAGIERTIKDRENTLQYGARSLAEREDIAEALGTRNFSELRDLLDGEEESMGVDILFVTNASGLALAGTASTSAGELDCVSSALEGEGFYSVEESPGVDYAMLASFPVFYDDEIVGCVVAGFDLSSEDFVTLIKEAYAMECSVFRENTIVASTLYDEDGESIVGEEMEDLELVNTVMRGGTYRGEEIIGDSTYQCYYFPLASEDGSVSGMVFMAKSEEIIQRTVRHTVLIAVPSLLVLCAIFMVLGVMMIYKTIHPLVKVKQSFDDISAGDADLTKRIEVVSHDEIGDVVVGFNTFSGKLQTIIAQIKASKDDLSREGESMSLVTQDTSSAISQIIANINDIHQQITSQGGSVSQTAGAVNQISSNIDSLNNMIAGQSASVTEASAAVEEMIGNISSVNESVEKMANSFGNLDKDVQTGVHKQLSVNEKLLEIETQSKMLGDANKAIASIARQTNLLAMNAAIEAAHAGEAGKGFSVVADEIRKLSETSSDQSRTIGQQLEKIRESIGEVVSASKDSSVALSAVSEKIKDTDQLVAQIRLAMDEQNRGSKQISTALKNMNDSTVEVHNASGEMADGNRMILSEIRRLQDATSVIQSSMGEMAVSANKISDTGTALGDIAQKVKVSINKIGVQIDQFSV